MADNAPPRRLEFSFTLTLDGEQRDFSLPLPDRDRANLYARRTLDLLVGIGALRDGSMTIGERVGDEFQQVDAWRVADGSTPERAPPSRG